MSPSRKLQVMFAYAFSRIADFSRIFWILFLSYGAFKIRAIKLRFVSPAAAREWRAWSLAIVRKGICWGVTAGKASYKASNARDFTAGKMGRNSSEN